MGYKKHLSPCANEQYFIAHHTHKVILQDDDERDLGALQGQRETDCKRWGGGGLVEEGEWINKSVPSASLGPAQSFKWVDVGSGVSTFFSLLFSSLLFLLLSFSAIRMADPPPPRSPPSYQLYQYGLSLSLPRTNACTRMSSIPGATTYLRFDYVPVSPHPHPAGLITILLRSASCPDVGVIIRWKPSLPIRVRTIWLEHLRRGCCSILTALVSQERQKVYF